MTLRYKGLLRAKEYEKALDATGNLILNKQQAPEQLFKELKRSVYWTIGEPILCVCLSVSTYVLIKMLYS